MVFLSKTVLRFLGLLCFLATCVVIIVVVLWAVSRGSKHPAESKPSPELETLYGKFEHAAIVTNAAPCASVAKYILRKGGKAVDAMIAAMLCDGLSVPQSMGIGGGFFMVVYDRKHKNVSTIIARETAPAAATENMYHGNATSSQMGGLSIGIPGEMKGYWTAYTKFGGGVSWKEIFLPIISMCEQGIIVNDKLASILVKYEELIKTNDEFRTLFVNFTTGALLKEGMKYKNLQLAKTLKIIAEHGGDAFYRGPLAASLVSDIRDEGGIITEADLNNYQVDMPKPLTTKLFGNLTFYSVEPPASGLVLAYILRLLDGLLPGDNEMLNVQRMTEALKYSYGARGLLGDYRYVNITNIKKKILSNDYIKKIRDSIDDTKTWNDPKHYTSELEEARDKGTANLAVLDQNGDAVVATSTINLHFGSKVVSKSLGIILNDQMDDFSTTNQTNYFDVAPSPVNNIKPGKRPMSSMCPSIIVDSQGDVKLLIGAAGGTKITSAVAIATARALLMRESIRSAMDNVLFHHQLLPMIWQYYPEISQDIVKKMEQIGHKVEKIAPTSFAAVTAIYRDADGIYGSCDRKRPGQVDGY